MAHNLVEQYIHVAWATKGLRYHISDEILLELYPYIAQTVKVNNGLLLAVGGSANHLHLLIRLGAEISLSTMMKNIKAFSSKWLRKTGKVDPVFRWQDGYSAYSVQENRVMSVSNYIENDHLFHKDKSYKDELHALLQQQSISFKPEFLLSSTHTKLLTHFIWSTKLRQPFLDKKVRAKLYEYLGNILAEEKGEMIEIGGVEDHIHLLIDVPKRTSLSEIVKNLKTKSTRWMQSNSSIKDFGWQTGFGGFSVSIGSAESVCKYIQRQEEHHREKSYQEEWNDFAKKKNISM